MDYSHLITFDENKKLKFHVDNFKKIVQKSGMRSNTKLCIISILGPYRTGKSFLMNCLLNKLLNDQDITNFDVPNIFPSGYGDQPVTNSIMMYNKLIMRKGVGYLILDTPGLFDTQTDQQSTMIIFGITAILSSFIIYNVDKRIQENHLENIALFSEYANMTNTNDIYGILGDINILLRDYQGYDTVKFNHSMEHCQSYLNEILKKKNRKSLDITRNSIQKSYQKISCYALPHPGLKIVHKNFDGKKDDLEKEFKQHMTKYLSHVIEQATCKMIDGQELLLGEIEMLVQKYLELFNNADNGFPQALNILETSCEYQLYRLKERFIVDYKNTIHKYVGNSYIFPLNLKKQHQLILKKILDKYNNYKYIIEVKDRKKQVCDEMLCKIDEIFMEIKAVNKTRNPYSQIKNVDPVYSGLVTFIVYSLSSTCSDYYSVCSVGHSISFYIILFTVIYVIYKLFLTFQKVGNSLNLGTILKTSKAMATTLPSHNKNFKIS